MRYPTEADIERERRESLRKGQLDYLTDLRAERRLAFEEGKAAATVQNLQSILRQPISEFETLVEMKREELFALQFRLTQAAHAAVLKMDDIQ